MMLEAFGPLALLASQLMHAGKPLFGSGVGHLAEFLESPDAMAGLVEYLGAATEDPAADAER